MGYIANKLTIQPLNGPQTFYFCPKQKFTVGPSIKYITHGGGGWLVVGLSVTKRYMGVGADRYVTLILNFICLVFSLSTECLVQYR